MTAPPRRPFDVIELDHLVLRVRDQRVAQHFYTDVLGLVVDHVNEPIRLIQLRAGRHLVDLLPLPSGDASPAAERLDHVCFAIRCPDLPAAVAFLRGRGVPVEGDLAIRRGAFGSGASVYIRDPDGYRIELKPS